MGRPLVDPTLFAKYTYPQCKELPVIAESPVNFSSPGVSSNPRMALPFVFLQNATYLDYYTGDHGLSERLRANPSRNTIPAEHLPLFPQFGVSAQWPPTLLLHGSGDTPVPVTESQNMYALLKDAGVEVDLRVVDGKEHLFDQQPDAEELYGEKDGLFDSVAAFLITHLRG